MTDQAAILGTCESVGSACVNKTCEHWRDTLQGCRYQYDRTKECECRNDVSEKPDGKRPPGEPRWPNDQVERTQKASKGENDDSGKN